MKHLQKSLALLLCIILCLSFFPVSTAFAEETDVVEEEPALQDNTVPEEQEEIPVVEEIVAFSENQSEGNSLTAKGEAVSDANVSNDVVSGEGFLDASLAYSVVNENGQFYLYKDGIFCDSYIGVAEYGNAEFIVTNGVFRTDLNGLVLLDETWFFVAGGQIQRVDGFAEYDGHWFIIKNGELDTNANGLYGYNGGTFLFSTGKLRNDVNGLWMNSNGKWYFLANGQVQTQYSGVAMYDGAFFVVEKGVLNDNYNGTIEYDGKEFYVKNGQLAGPTDSINYDPVIDHYQIPAGLGLPQYNVDEIQQMIADNLSLDEVASRIATYADLIQYLHQKNYVMDTRGDLKFAYEKYQFHVNRSAQTVFNDNSGNCGGSSNLVNYILRGDYDSQGYVQESGEQGGHIYNFFLSDGIYYFADLTQIVGPENAYHHNYTIYTANDPQEFSNWYIGMNHKYCAANAGPYLIFQYLYPYDGDHRPIGSTEDTSDLTLTNYPYHHYLPKSLEPIATILFVDDRYEGAIFVEDPPLELWPKEAK